MTVARLAVITLALLCSVYTIGGVTIYPSLYPDAAGGLLVKKSMAAGAPWNHITEPRADDISQDHSYFYATWSPGQYAVPAMFEALGLTLGRAVTVVCVLGSLVGLLGWLLLFRSIGFDSLTTLVSGVVIASSRSFNLSYLTYVGSDLLAFAAFPLFAVIAFACRRSWAIVPVAALLVLCGFFLKNSMAIYVAAWTVAVTGVAAIQSGTLRSAMTWRFAATAAAMVLAFAAIQSAYLSRGWTPLSYQPALSASPAAYVLPWAMPLLAATAIDDVINRTISRPGEYWFDYKNSALFLLPIALATVGFVIDQVRARERHRTAPELVAASAIIVAVFAALYATGSAASLSLSRHYLIPGFLLLPLLVRRIIAERPAIRYALAIALALPCVYGVASFASNWNRHYERRMAHSPDVEITYPMLTPRLVAFLDKLDRELPKANNLVVTSSHDYALAFSRQRVLPTSVTSDSAESIASNRRRGKVDNLVVMAELGGMSDREIAAWLASFDSYRSERWEHLDADGFRLFVPAAQAVNREWLAATWAAAR